MNQPILNEMKLYRVVLISFSTSYYLPNLLKTNFRLRVQLGVNMPAQANRKVSQGISSSNEAELFEVYDVVLYLGIIDILQGYNMRKKIEQAYKSKLYDPMLISVADPKFYSKRFFQYLEKVFPADT